jgi:hypothetical protein
LLRILLEILFVVVFLFFEKVFWVDWFFGVDFDFGDFLTGIFFWGFLL